MFLLNSEDLFYSSNIINRIKNVGTADYFKKIQMGSVPSIGSPGGCITTPVNESPWIASNASAILRSVSNLDEVVFKLEILNVRKATEEEIEAGGPIGETPDIEKSLLLPI